MLTIQCWLTFLNGVVLVRRQSPRSIVFHYVTGFVLKEQAVIDVRKSGRGDALDLGEILTGRPLETMIEAARSGGDPLGDEVFEHGLRMIIVGTEHRLLEPAGEMNKGGCSRLAGPHHAVDESGILLQV